MLATLPAGLTDPEKHCVASAGIAVHCSRFEASLAGYGTEIRDAIVDGAASWHDLYTDRIGRRTCPSSVIAPSARQVRYQLKAPYRDGTTHIVLEPLIEIEACARCHGRLRVLASIEGPAVITRILAPLDRTTGTSQPGRAPPVQPALR